MSVYEPSTILTRIRINQVNKQFSVASWESTVSYGKNSPTAKDAELDLLFYMSSAKYVYRTSSIMGLAKDSSSRSIKYLWSSALLPEHNVWRLCSTAKVYSWGGGGGGGVHIFIGEYQFLV